MNRARIPASVQDAPADDRHADVIGRISSPGSARTAAGCFHCGERCGPGAVVEGGRQFCCLGCRTVFALLTESGLDQFYEMGPAPGARVGRATAQAQWAFLDDAAVQETLLDYAEADRAIVALHLPAIHCMACVWLLENLYRLEAGIGESRVNFGRREARIAFDPGRVKLSAIAALLASLGYEPALTLADTDPGGKHGDRKAARWSEGQWMRLGVAGFGFGNAMLLALPGYLGLDSQSGPWFRALAGWLGLALALPVLVYSASDYWRAAWIGLRRRVLTLDAPIALGLAAIYGWSVFEVASGRGEGYCDSLTGLILFLLCGRLFQRKTFDRLAFDRDYKGFFPLSTLRMSAAGEEAVPISKLAVGDRLLVRHGELVPADARLVRGDARIDYSFVTGESEPVTRRAGDRIHAGGRQTGGAIEIETVKSVSESYLTSLWNNEAFRKPVDDTFDSLTNRYSRRFTPAVIAVAVAAAAYWLVVDASVAVKAFTSVLIVACPCALALAAPLTLGTAHRTLARRHVFLRNAQVIEHLAEVDTLVFDKTGTLTANGSGSVQWNGEPLAAEERIQIHALARHSAHPLAVRIAESMTGTPDGAPVSSFVETPGCGMEGRMAGRDLWMGSAPWLESRGAHRSAHGRPTARPDASDLEDKDGSRVHVAIDGRHRGCFVLESALRPEVEALIGRLRGRYQLVLLSGDHGREAERFRSLLGGSARVAFNQSPFDKLNVIRELQDAGARVMMVGDGLNDAGALKQADVGVAVVENTGAFSPASDVILTAAQLPRLAEVVAFSRHAARVVRAGFMVSGLYNVIGVSIAAAGWLSPLVCAVLMPLSSATVVLFSIGATRWMARRALGSGGRVP